MAIQSAANLKRVPKQLRMSVLIGVAGAALAGGVVLGVQQTQQTSHSHGTTTRSAVPAAAAVNQPRTTTPVYLVRTAEQEQALRAWLALGSTGGPDGAQPAAVILAPAAAEASFARAALVEQSQQAPRHAASNATGTATGGTRPHSTTTVYLAHTPEQARTLAAWVAQGRFGVPAGAPANAAVILAPSAGEAAFARAALLEWRSVTGAPPEVVDLQTSP